MVAWNLPASIEDVSGVNKLPDSILQKSQLIKDKGGIAKIDSMMAELPSLLQRNTEILNVTKRALEEEEQSDTELRSQMREKWTRTPSKDLNSYLHQEIQEFHRIINNAIKANSTIETKYKTHRDGIQLLSKPANEIGNSLPAASPLAALQNSFVVKELRRLMEKVAEIKAVRDVLESEMKTMDSDVIQARLVSALQSSNGADQHSIIQEELEGVVGPIRDQVRKTIQSQEELLINIEKANSDFLREKGSNHSTELRDEMLKNLSSAGNIYNELHENLQEGSKFYNELTPILLRFQNKVDDFVFARKTEKDDLMKDIQSALSRPGSSSAAAASALNKPPRPSPPAPSFQTDSARPPLSSVQQQGPPPPPYPVNPYYPMMPVYPYAYYPPQQQQQGGQPQQQQPPQYPYQSQNPYYPSSYPQQPR